MPPIGLHLPATLGPETRERLLAIFELAPIGIGIVDFEGRTIMSNEVLRKMLGYSREEFAQMPFEEFTHPDDVAANQERFERLSRGEIESFEMDKRFFRKDGSILWGHLTSSLLVDADGRPEYAIGMLEDITETKLLAETLGAVQERYRLLVEHVPAVVYIAEPGAAGRWHYVSPQSVEILGFTPEEWMSDPDLWFRQVHPDDRVMVIGEEDDIVREKGQVFSSHYRMFRRDGSLIWVRDDAMAAYDEDGNLMFHGLLVDVTREKELEARLEYQAFHDPLTRLPNRRLFRDRVEHCLKRLERSQDRAAVLFVDLDNFKSVNDGLGHAHGDQLLVLVAERISACLRGGDTAARLGGDEFALLIEDIDAEADAVSLADRLLHAIRHDPYEIEGRIVTVGASVGIAVQGPFDSADTLLRNADLAMYRAKARGKGNFAIFEASMHEAASSRLRMESALRGDVERARTGETSHGLSVAFQPIVGLGSRETVGFEALARWSHPSFGDVTPAVFIPLAEEAGLIDDLGAWVLDRACRELVTWRAGGERSVHISVNVSPIQLEDDRFPDVVAATLERAGLEPEALILEVTEGVLLVEHRRETLERLRALGVKIALDDFGTGYSSLGYLRQFPLDVLKIDRSFVNHIKGEVEDRAFVHAIIKLANTLCMEIVAEGIETDEQLEALQDVGCHFGQGYLLARPGTLT